jgi:hypothetical protein
VFEEPEQAKVVLLAEHFGDDENHDGAEETSSEKHVKQRVLSSGDEQWRLREDFHRTSKFGQRSGWPWLLKFSQSTAICRNAMG